MDGPQGVSETTATIEGLDPDTEYEVQIRSSSSGGDGEWSGVGTVMTDTLPPPPVKPEVGKTSSTSVTVSWTAPTTDGAPVTSYDVRYRAGSEGEWVDGPQGVSETTATIEGLDPDTEYEVQIRSSSSGGDGEWSGVGTVMTDTLPPPPVKPEVGKTSSTSVTVSWTAPTTDGAPVTSYDVRYRAGSEGEWVDGPQGVSETTATIEGLDPDTEYEVQIRSSSSGGDGEWTALGVVRTAVLVLHDLFSLSLDLNALAGDQSASVLFVSPGEVLPLRVFAAGIRDTRNLSVGVRYDSTQVAYESFDVGDAFPNAHAFVERDSNVVVIGIASLGAEVSVDSGVVVTVRFRAMEAFSETEIRLVAAQLVRGGPLEVMTRSVCVVLQAAPAPSPDFDANGVVDFGDFVLFARAFGSGEGDENYQEKYDLDGDREIAFGDFVVFAGRFGASVNRAPVFTASLPSTLSIAENTPAGQTIGGPVSAVDADGDALTYALWGVDADAFAIDGKTGQILSKGEYDYEAKRGYAVIVRASDGRGGSVNVVVSIAVTDVDE